uniref:Adapter molecule Crk n=1 Tax=Romanomermis culicivorax TaxID=13658 RepID=A0A915HRZ8_ROMCU
MADSQRNSSEPDRDDFPLTFDPADVSSWHFGDATREEVVQMLENEADGVFCVRESSSQKGNLVLSVKETDNGKDQPVSHYLITVTRTADNTPTSYVLGDQVFLSMTQLLKYYLGHYLESTNLLRPAKRVYVKMIAKYDFHGQEECDLPFKTNEILYVTSGKVENSWLMARNVLGRSGLIPSNYVEECQNEDGSCRNSCNSFITDNSHHSEDSSSINFPIKTLPAYARVKMPRNPNAYDKTALKLEVNDRIKVLKMDPSGTWEGELNGKIGFFPFTYIEWEDEA